MALVKTYRTQFSLTSSDREDDGNSKYHKMEGWIVIDRDENEKAVVTVSDSLTVHPLGYDGESFIIQSAEPLALNLGYGSGMYFMPNEQWGNTDFFNIMLHVVSWHHNEGYFWVIPFSNYALPDGYRDMTAIFRYDGITYEIHLTLDKRCI